ncbi:MAG: tautomerase family protein [Roseiflexaceae bacterium]|nr:tautomerase family protein [Roseiflexaceae bacterium]
MAQIKIYGLREQLVANRARISATIHRCVVEVLGLPQEKCFHRFIALDADDFIFPADRSACYTIIEISMFEGRTVETKKLLIELLFDTLWRACAIAPQDVEITISETPRHNWGIRGQPADELALNYQVER